MKKTLFCTVAACAIVALGALATVPAQAQGKGIVYITPSLNVSFWRYVASGVEASAKSAGYSVTTLDSNNDGPTQLKNAQDAIAKGAAGIMQHYSPARLRKPLLRVGERGAGEFREIEWDEALDLATSWLKPIRERNPDELAFFTGRDQSQALTGWWAQQFGTVNYAAHGGFCSVNMAAGGLYSVGGSFWEFGEPD